MVEYLGCLWILPMDNGISITLCQAPSNQQLKENADYWPVLQKCLDSHFCFFNKFSWYSSYIHTCLSSLLLFTTFLITMMTSLQGANKPFHQWKMPVAKTPPPAEWQQSSWWILAKTTQQIMTPPSAKLFLFPKLLQPQWIWVLPLHPWILSPFPKPLLWMWIAILQQPIWWMSQLVILQNPIVPDSATLINDFFHHMHTIHLDQVFMNPCTQEWEHIPSGHSPAPLLFSCSAKQNPLLGNGKRLTTIQLTWFSSGLSSHQVETLWLIWKVRNTEN